MSVTSLLIIHFNIILITSAGVNAKKEFGHGESSSSAFMIGNGMKRFGKRELRECKLTFSRFSINSLCNKLSTGMSTFLEIRISQIYSEVSK